MNKKMAINNMFYQFNLKKKTNEEAEQKQTHRYKEHFDGCGMGGSLGGRVKKVEGIKKHKWTE